ncbi:MAG: TIGR01777 family oxidoreductase [Planctomycetota bacterium]|nr:TIGR01777 family oxidoreductase [Planctomycetota bacterium]
MNLIRSSVSGIDPPAQQVQTVLITGSSGLIGSALIPQLQARGHRVIRAVRRNPRVDDEIRWRPLEPPEQIPAAERKAFDKLDAVIHLAGEDIASGRWSSTKKKKLRSSRVDATANLVSLLQQLPSAPATFISASAIGGYPANSDELLTEAATFSSGFLGQLCRDWESASSALEEIGTRVVRLRIGLVLSPDGGILRKLLPLFRFCLGSRMGSGRQWMSWIDLEDLVQIIRFVLEDQSIEGSLNCTAPHSVRNVDFTRTLAAALRRPVAPPIPGPIIRLLLGEMGQSLILDGQRVAPTRLLDLGYRFTSPDLPAALRHQLRRR